MSSVMERLMAARHSRFVGRVAEQQLFQAALDASELPFVLLYIYGPGGFGKTTLIHEYVRSCRARKIPAYELDARHLDASPDGFLWALRGAMGLDPQQSPLDVLASTDRRQVILIDTYEMLTPLDGWLRDVFLPRLSQNVLTVIAARQQIPAPWRSDPGWQDLIRVVPLRNLNREDTETYLTKSGVPPEQQTAIIDFTHGHPLALSLMVDTLKQDSTLLSKPQSVPDVIRILMERFIQAVPSAQHRAALEACALVRITHEKLLAEMLGVPDAFELFDWLRNLSFVEVDSFGLFPHDLTRDVLATDLRWRNVEQYQALHRRAREYYLTRLKAKPDAEQARLLFDLIYLHKDNPAVKPFFDWQQTGSLFATGLQDADIPVLIEMVRHFEGDDSAKYAAYWFREQPQGVRVIRDSNQIPAGFLMALALHRVENPSVDAATESAARYLSKNARLRPGEAALLFRYWMARDSYQSVSPAQSLLFILAVQFYLTTPGLAFHFLPCADADFWLPLFTYGNLSRLPEADFEVGGHRYGNYGHDWRQVPVSNWLDLLAEREIGNVNAQPEDIPTRILEPTVVLTQEEFEDAVQDALRSILRADELVDNPLVRSRLVIQRSNSSAGELHLANTLVGLLKEAAEQLKLHPRDSKFYQAVHYAYIHPSATQEQAAELLDLPFSTFRRHLKMGVQRIAEILWAQEIGGLETVNLN